MVTRLDPSTAALRLVVHLLYLCAAVGLTWWGLRDAHRLRVNVGVFAFALTVLSFYFSSVFDKFGRSLGLIALAGLWLAGWNDLLDTDDQVSGHDSQAASAT